MYPWCNWLNGDLDGDQDVDFDDLELFTMVGRRRTMHASQELAWATLGCAVLTTYLATGCNRQSTRKLPELALVFEDDRVATVRVTWYGPGAPMASRGLRSLEGEPVLLGHASIRNGRYAAAIGVTAEEQRDSHVEARVTVCSEDGAVFKVEGIDASQIVLDGSVISRTGTVNLPAGTHRLIVKAKKRTPVATRRAESQPVRGELSAP